MPPLFWTGLTGSWFPVASATEAEGKISAVRYARETGIPFFGICLGLQVAVIEFARNVCEMTDANSVEFDDKNEFPVIHLMATSTM